MKKQYKIEMNINAVVYGNAIRHKATYITELELDSRFENASWFEESNKKCAAIQALTENYLDVADQFEFVLDGDKKAVVQSYATKILFAEASKVQVTAI